MNVVAAPVAGAAANADANATPAAAAPALDDTPGEVLQRPGESEDDFLHRLAMEGYEAEEEAQQYGMQAGLGY